MSESAIEIINLSKRFVDLKPTTFAVITMEGAERVRSQMVRMRELVSLVIEKDSDQSQK